MKKMYWYIGIGVIAIVFFTVPIYNNLTPFQYIKNLVSGTYSE